MVLTCVFKFRLLPPSGDRLPHHASDCLSAAVTAARVGVRGVW